VTEKAPEPEAEGEAAELPAVALEPETMPIHPLRAMDVPALLAKHIA
jgi:hypothetical protein